MGGGGGPFSIIVDPIGTILGAISPALGDIWTTLGKWTGIYYVQNFLADNIIAPIVKFLFGLEDKDIYEVDVIAVKMFQEDLYKKTQLDLVTNYMKKEEYDAKNYALDFANTGDKQFGKYYRTGKWYYVDYLPQLRVTGTTMPTVDIKTIIERQISDTIFIKDVLLYTPSDNDWCKYQLQEKYDYDVGGDFVKIDNNYYKFNSCSYGNSLFSVSLSPITTVNAKVYEITTVTVNPVSKVNIKVYEIDTGAIVTKNLRVETSTNTAIGTAYEELTTIVYNRNTITVEPILETVTTKNPDGTTKIETVHKNDLVTITKTKITEIYITSSNQLAAKGEEVLNTSSTQVIAGSITPSETTEIVSEETAFHYVKFSSKTETKIYYYPDSDRIFKSDANVIESELDLIDEPIELIKASDKKVTTEAVELFEVTRKRRTLETDADGNVITDTTEIISTSYNQLTGSQTEYDTSTLISEIGISDNEIERTVVTKRTSYSSKETGALLSTIDEVISDTSKAVPIGTGHSYTNIVLLSDGTITTESSSNYTVSVPSHNNARLYFVRYATSLGRERLWVYDAGTNAYPSLSTPYEYSTDIEAYPITMLRNYYFDINEYNVDSKYGRDRPAAITKKRYDSTVEVLNAIGMDPKTLIEAYSKNENIEKLQDCYFLVGVSPSNTSTIVSKVLFEMFDYICDRMTFIPSLSVFSAAYKEQAYNASIMWEPITPYFTEEVIGSIGTYKHTVNGNDIHVKKQITATETKTVFIKNLSGFTIVNWGISKGGKNFEGNNENLVIPLPVAVVERLTLMDKTQLLGNSAYLIFYSFQHQHLEWYQTEEFANAMKIITIGIAVVVTIIVTVFTFGTGTAAAVSLSSMLMSALKAVAIGVGLSLALQFIANNVQDTRLKMALSIAATAVAIWAGGGFAAGQSMATTATQLVQLCSTAINVYAQDMQQRIQKEMNKLKDEALDFQKRYEKRSKELSDQYQSMNSGLTAENMVGLIDMTSFETSRNASDDILMLSPSQFYNLAIGAYRNYDTLYTGMYDQLIHKFCKNKLNMGVTQDAGEE